MPWDFKLLCNRITARCATKTTQNPAADFYTISVRQLSNPRENFKVWSKERVEPKPKVFRCFNHRALIEVTAFETWPRGVTRVGIKVCFADASNSLVQTGVKNYYTQVIGWKIRIFVLLSSFQRRKLRVKKKQKYILFTVILMNPEWTMSWFLFNFWAIKPPMQSFFKYFRVNFITPKLSRSPIVT